MKGRWRKSSVAARILVLFPPLTTTAKEPPSVKVNGTLTEIAGMPVLRAGQDNHGIKSGWFS